MNTEIIKQKDCLGLTPGLSGTQIKIIGVIMMVFDHLHQMFYTHGVPLWFTWIGRPVLPLFLFMGAEGFIHTRSKKRYLFQLFIGFEAMNIISTVFTFALPNDDVMLINNVFQTLLLSCLYMLFIEMLADGIRAKQAGKITKAVLLMTAVALAGIALALLLNVVLDAVSPDVPRWLVAVVYGGIPNILGCEGGFTAVIMGVLFYLLREKRFLQLLMFAALGILSLVMYLQEGNSLFSGGAQWLMIFALIPFMLYNGKRGKGGKYFFYVFYPAHIYLLYTIAYFIRLK
ncbi:MAG: conjugal transfer protein TraX [Spirochaetaceae bacterium]|nr:conjugal transfer protein TraX [Spirochaetaceae bacterium]